MKFIIGKKKMMTQIWQEDRVFAVTPVVVGPCQIAQIKNQAKDGYEAVQVAYGTRKPKNIKKPQIGHLKTLDIKPAHLREFRTKEAANYQVGDIISVETFSPGDKINVIGVSKGKGFQGVVKRHGFHGFRKTHGNKDQERMPGSIGAKGPAHVFKGTRMAGRMGGDRVTVSNLEVMDIDVANDLIFIKGAIPGAINGLILISGEGELKVNLKKTIAPEKVEENIVTEESVTEEKPGETSDLNSTESAELATEEKPAEKEEVKTEEVKTEEVKSEAKAS